MQAGGKVKDQSLNRVIAQVLALSVAGFGAGAAWAQDPAPHRLLLPPRSWPRGPSPKAAGWKKSSCRPSAARSRCRKCRCRSRPSTGRPRPHQRGDPRGPEHPDAERRTRARRPVPQRGFVLDARHRHLGHRKLRRPGRRGIRERRVPGAQRNRAQLDTRHRGHRSHARPAGHDLWPQRLCGRHCRAHQCARK